MQTQRLLWLTQDLLKWVKMKRLNNYITLFNMCEVSDAFTFALSLMQREHDGRLTKVFGWGRKGLPSKNEQKNKKHASRVISGQLYFSAHDLMILACGPCT